MKLYKIFMISFLCIGSLYSKYVVIKDEQQFLKELHTHEFVVACFLEHSVSLEKSTQNSKLKKEMELIKDMVKSVAYADPYKKDLRNDVSFLIIDINKENLKSLADRYKIACEKNVPQFLLFKHGKITRNPSGKAALLVGFIAKSDLLKFIDNYFGKKLDKVLAKKAEKDEQVRQKQLARYQIDPKSHYPYGGYSPFNPWGDPYIYTGYAEFYPYGYGYNGYLIYMP